RGSTEKDNLGLLDLAVLLPQSFGNLVRAQLGMTGALLERSQNDEHPADVGDICAGENRVTGHADRVAHTLRFQSQLGHASDHLTAALQAGAIGELCVDDEVALVLFRDETRGNGLEAEVGQSDEAAVDQQDDHTYTEKQGDHMTVEVRGPVEAP